MSRFQFLADHRDTFEVKRLCEVIEVNRSSFYAWDAAAPARAQRAAVGGRLAQRIRVVHEGDKAYGAPRITAKLNDGVPAQNRVNHKRVARVMTEHGTAGIRLRRCVRTAIPEPSDQKVPICSTVTSPPRRRTASTSATSPTCRWPRAETFTWPP